MTSILTDGIGRLIMTAGVFLMAAGAAVTGLTGAVFSDTDSVGGNVFSTGTVTIGASPASAVVTFSDMAPGDSVVGDMTVSNDGTLELRYAVTSTTTENTLAAQLDFTIWDEAEEADGGTDCNASAPVTVLYGAADLGSTSGIDAIGDPAQGSQSGDRTLSASTSEVLCFLVALPSSSGNSYQGLSSTSTVAFQAEQTANN